MVLLVSPALAAPAVKPAPPRLYGVLGAQNGIDGQKDYVRDDYRHGVPARTLEIGWNVYEPQDSRFSAAYAAKVKGALAEMRRAGCLVVLDLGTQYAPAWAVRLQPFQDQYGDVLDRDGDPANPIWSPVVRQKMTAYIQRVFHDLGTDFLAVRLGSGSYVETLYPDSYPGRPANFCYWAYDADARRVNPVSPWKPGDPSPHGEAKRFYDWYVAQLMNTVNWQMDTVRRCGYRGNLLQLFPGLGVHGAAPLGLAGLLRGNLMPATGYGYDGAGRAAQWDRLIAGIRDKTNVVIECSSVGDSSSNPAEFTNLDDASPDPLHWSSAHYVAFLADRNRLPKWAESVGPPYVGLAGMARVFRLVNTYDYSGLWWAFDTQLHDGKPDHASLDNYQRFIRSNQETGRG